MTEFQPRGSGGQRAGFVSYDYSWDRTTYHGQSQISLGGDPQMNLGSYIDVKILPITPAYNAIPILENGSGAITVFSIPFALFWNGLLFLAYRIFLWPLLLSKKLARSGIPTAGAIQHKEIQTGHQHYRVSFGYVADPNLSPTIYQLVAGGPPLNPLRGEIYVTKAQYDSVKAGQWVTVLFDPQNPKRAVVYQLSRHIAV